MDGPTIPGWATPITRRDLLKRGGILAASSGALGAVLAACTKGATTTKQQTGGGPQQVEFGLANAFAGFNPATAPQVASLTVIHHVFEPLIRYDQFSNTLKPWMFQALPSKSQALMLAG